MIETPKSISLKISIDNNWTIIKKIIKNHSVLIVIPLRIIHIIPVYYIYIHLFNN